MLKNHTISFDGLNAWKKDFAACPIPLKLVPCAQHYDWGQTGKNSFIAQLLNVSAQEQFWAELWLGAHPLCPSLVQIENAHVNLRSLIQAAPETILGQDQVKSWQNELPFLFKIIAASRPLSIQAHPDFDQAAAAFAEQKYPSIYKDSFGKWEQIIALGDFYLLAGFRPLEESVTFLKNIAQIETLVDFTSLRSIFESILFAPCAKVQAVLELWLKQLQNQKESFQKNQHEFWILQSSEYFSQDGIYDRGLLLIGLLNLKQLKEGESIFLFPGQVHAYLEGVGAEIMTSSDNTLRCALTKKEVHPKEVLKTLLFDPKPLEVLLADAQGKYLQKCSSFNIAWLKCEGGVRTFKVQGLELLFVLKGTVTLICGQTSYMFSAGQGVLVPGALKEYQIQSNAASIFRCTSGQGE